MNNTAHFINTTMGILTDPFNLIGCALIGYANKKSFGVFLWCIIWAIPVLFLGNFSSLPEIRILGNGISYLMIVYIDSILICSLKGLFKRKKEVRNDSIEDEEVYELEENMLETGQNKSNFGANPRLNTAQNSFFAKKYDNKIEKNECTGDTINY